MSSHGIDLRRGTSVAGTANSGADNSAGNMLRRYTQNNGRVDTQGLAQDLAKRADKDTAATKPLYEAVHRQIKHPLDQRDFEADFRRALGPKQESEIFKADGRTIQHQDTTTARITKPVDAKPTRREFAELEQRTTKPVDSKPAHRESAELEQRTAKVDRPIERKPTKPVDSKPAPRESAELEQRTAKVDRPIERSPSKPVESKPARGESAELEQRTTKEERSIERRRDEPEAGKLLRRVPEKQ